jgi:pimeloyl-ACP methyl ester carboxylesterase
VLLLLHGWCDDRSQFHDLLPRCAQSRRVLGADLPGHGDSEAPPGDFGYRELLAAAAGLVESSGAERIVPVTAAHAGWIGIGLRRRLGAARIPALVLLDWIVLDPPRAFLEALQSLQDPERWKSTRAQLFALWLGGADPKVAAHVRRTMGDQGFGMWARSAREISAAYAREGNPCQALAALEPATPTLHLFPASAGEAARDAQDVFRRRNKWFFPRELPGRTHFPALEAPAAVASAIEDFLADHVRAAGT